MGASNQELVITWLGPNSPRTIFGELEQRVEIGEGRLLDGKRIGCKVWCQEGELVKYGMYRLFGRYQTHPSYGEQYIAKTWIEEKPVDEDSIIAYLTQCKGPAKGSITHRVAVKLFEAYGCGVIDKLIKEPTEVASLHLPRWSAQATAIASQYLERQDYRRVAKLQLIKLFEGRGFPKQTTDRAIRKWGIKAGEVVRTTPYSLMELPSIGFKGADKLYCELAREAAGTDNNAYLDALAMMHRQGLCMCHEVAQDRSGSTWMQANIAKASVRRNVSGARAKPDEALAWAIQENRLVSYESGRTKWVANSRNALHEQQVAWFIEDVPFEDVIQGEWPTIGTIMEYCSEERVLSQHQQDGLAVALSSRVGCLQGSPGVGKTVTVSVLVKAIAIGEFGSDSVAVACPTGKAAVRASQALLENGVELDVRTIHRLLGVESQIEGGWKFTHNEENPLPYRFIVIDESSMIDITLMAALLRACTSDTHILFVGDVNQLAPVGHGRPFEDIQQLIPTGHLTEIRRNSGRIVQACAEIRDDRKFTPSRMLDIDLGENMPLIELDDPDEQVRTVENLIRKLGTEDEDCDSTWDIQVVTAINDRSEVSRKPLNNLLQGVLNPDGGTVKGNPFRIGDKIVCLKNGQYQDTEDRHFEHFVANGELAEVMDLKPGRMFLRLFDPPRSIVVPHAVTVDKASGEDDTPTGSRGAVGDWDLGYVLSVHRSQGSQWKYVIVMVDGSGSASMIQSRNWLYTAISRAEIATFLLGKRSVCQKMMTKDGTSDRKTFLVERTRHSRAVRLVNHEELFAPV